MVEQNSESFGDGAHFEIGDGAPIHALFGLKRAALKHLRGGADSEDAMLDAQDDDGGDRGEAEPREEYDSEEDDSVSPDSSEDGSASEESTSSKTAGDAENEGAAPIPRRPIKKLTQQQASVLTKDIILVPGIWHCMQEFIILNLECNRGTWMYFARDWRKTEGRLKFLLGCGNVNEALHELFSSACGILKWWIQRYRKTQPENPSYVGFDEFMDEEAASYPVMAKLRDVIEHTLLTKCLHDSMRQGMLKNVRLLLQHLIELCAAAGKHKYSRLLTDFMVQIATMPEKELAHLHAALFAELGGFFAPNDEFTEILHCMFWRMIGRLRSDRAWAKSILQASCSLPYEEPGRNLGASSGVGRAPSGHRMCDLFISSATRKRLNDTFSEEAATSGEFILDEVRHKLNEAVGFDGPLPAGAIDIQRTGRAIHKKDVSHHVFGPGASAVSRPNLPKVDLTPAQAQKARARRQAQIEATTAAAIEAVSYTRKEMGKDLNAYCNQPVEDIPPGILASLSGPRGEQALYRDKTGQSRREKAAALSRWRNGAAQVCANAHKNEIPPATDLQQLIEAETPTIERRREARRQLLAEGQLGGLGMVMTDTPAEEDADTSNPTERGSKWLADNRNIEQVGSGEGQSAVDSLQKFVNQASHGNQNRSVFSEQSRQSNGHRGIQKSVRKLKLNERQGSSVGRDVQMEAARSWRRTAEIDGILDERQAAKAMDKTGSYWLNPAHEPPAASIGNARLWKPPAQPAPPEAPTRAIAPRLSSSRRTSQAGGRRQSLCSCCGQPRTLGHVSTCDHRNETCSRCRHRRAAAAALQNSPQKSTDPGPPPVTDRPRSASPEFFP